MAEIYYHCPSNFSTLAKGLGWDSKEIKAQKKNMKEQGHKISLVKYVQEDPKRDEFVAKFQKDEAFRKHVDMGFASGKKSSQEDIDKYVTKYKVSAKLHTTAVVHPNAQPCFVRQAFILSQLLIRLGWFALCVDDALPTPTQIK